MKMRKLVLLTTLVALFFCVNTFALDDTESRFYTETWTNGVSKNLVTDYGANGNDNQDDSRILQNAIDDLTNLANGGRIFIPQGTYYLKFINMRSNVHLVFAGGTVIKEPANANPWGYVFGMGLSNKVENVSIRGNNGRFTVDYSSLPVGEQLRVFKMGDVSNFLVANVNILDNYTQYAGFSCLKYNNIWPRKGILKNADIKNARFGWGLVQVLAGETLLFKNISGTGGVTLRLETRIDNVNIHDIVGRGITNTNGHAGVFVSPHECNCGIFDIHDVKTYGSGFGVRIERGHSDNNGSRGTFNSNSKANKIYTQYGSSAQIRSDHRDYVPCEVKNLISVDPKVNTRYKGPSMAPVLYEQGSGAGYSNITLTNITKSGFAHQSKNIIDVGDKVKEADCSNTGGNTGGSSGAPIGSWIWISAYNGKYVCADKGKANTPFTANRSALGAWEKFQVVDAGGGYIALKANSNNKYASVRNNVSGAPLRAVAGSIGNWEKLTWETVSSGKVAFKAKVNSKYIWSQNNETNAPLYAKGTAIQGWETFTWGATTKSANSINTLTEFTVYPNPANYELNVKISGDLQQGALLMVYNSVGSMVESLPLTSNEYQLSTTHLLSGIYILKVINGKEIFTERFIKE